MKTEVIADDVPHGVVGLAVACAYGQEDGKGPEKWLITSIQPTSDRICRTDEASRILAETPLGIEFELPCFEYPYRLIVKCLCPGEPHKYENHETDVVIFPCNASQEVATRMSKFMVVQRDTVE